MTRPKYHLTAYDVMTEDEVQDSIIKVAEQVGCWMVYHTKDSRRSEPGFVDLVMIETRDPFRVLFVECKDEAGRLIKAKRAPKSGRELPGQDDWAKAIQNSEKAIMAIDWVEEFRGVEPRAGVYYHLDRPSGLEKFYAVLLGEA